MSRRSYFIPSVVVTGSAAFLFANFLGPQHRHETHHKEKTTYLSSYNAYTQATSTKEVVTPTVEVTYDYDGGGGGGGCGGGGGSYHVSSPTVSHSHYRPSRPHPRPRPRPRPHPRPRPRPRPKPHRPPHVNPHRPPHINPHRPPHVRPPHVRPPHVRPPHVRPPHVRPPHVRPPHVKPPHVKPPQTTVTPPVTPTPETPQPENPSIGDQLPEDVTITVRGEKGTSVASGQATQQSSRRQNRSALRDERGRRYEFAGSTRRADGSRRDVYRASDGGLIIRNTTPNGRVSFKSERRNGHPPRMVRDERNGHRSQVQSPGRRNEGYSSTQRRTQQKKPTVNPFKNPQRGKSIRQRSRGNTSHVSRPQKTSQRRMHPRPPSRPKPSIQRRPPPSRRRSIQRRPPPSRKRSIQRRSSSRMKSSRRGRSRGGRR